MINSSGLFTVSVWCMTTLLADEAEFKTIRFMAGTSSASTRLAFHKAKTTYMYTIY